MTTAAKGGVAYRDLYNKVDFELEETIGEDLQNSQELKSKIESFETRKLKNVLTTIKPSEYTKKRRLMFFLIHMELSKRGLAPYWRGSQRVLGVKARMGRELTDEEKRFAKDCQMADMEWIHSQYHGHKTNAEWQDMYKKIFIEKAFNFTRANIIASAEFKLDSKIKGLKLIKDMQQELFVFRSDSVRKERLKIKSTLESVDDDLVQASYRNRRRGAKLRDNLDVRLLQWECLLLVENLSLIRMCEMYKKMTGDDMHPSTFTTKLASTNKALNEVSSSHGY